MIRTRRMVWAAGLGVLVIGAASCKKKEPPPPAETSAAPATAPSPPAAAVQGIALGKSIDADKKVSAPTTPFGRKDTSCAAVTTEGAAPSKTVSAKWTFQDGQTVKEQSES